MAVQKAVHSAEKMAESRAVKMDHSMADYLAGRMAVKRAAH